MTDTERKQALIEQIIYVMTEGNESDLEVAFNEARNDMLYVFNVDCSDIEWLTDAEWLTIADKVADIIANQ